MPGLGGHRIIGSSIPAGRLKAEAKAEALAHAAFIFPLEVINVSVTAGTGSFTVTVSTDPSTAINGFGIANFANVFEATNPEYCNVYLLDSNREEILAANLNPLWGRVTSAFGTPGNYTYTVTTYNDLDRDTASPTQANLQVNTIPLVILPLRKPLSMVDQDELRSLNSNAESTLGDLSALDERIDDLEAYGTPVYNETPSGVVAEGNLNFTLAHAPIAGTTELFAYGLFLALGVHYNVTGTTLSYVAGFEPGSGETHKINYHY